MTRALRHAALLPLLCVLAACSFIPTISVPQDHYYRLPDPTPPRVYAHPPLGGAQGVAALRGIGLYQEQAIAFVDARSPLELHQYNYRFWVEPPTHLVQDYLVAYLVKAHAASKVMRFRPGEGAAASISGDIEHFERVTGNGRDEAVVTLTLEYGSPDQFRARRLDKRYSARAPISGRSMEAVAQAFGAALNQAAGRFLADIAALGPAAGH